MTGPAQPWLESAYRSLDAAEVLEAAGRWPQACFHAQQAVELALKALVAQHTGTTPRLHSIAEVLTRQQPAARQALDRSADDLRDLDTYYTATRYPDAIVGELPGQREAEEAVTAARDGVTIIAVLLGTSAG